MKTPAAILVEQRAPLIIDEVESPALSFGQVLVEISVSRICGSQIGEIDGVKGPDRYLPHLLGHEGGGIVREVGPSVTRVRAGDHEQCRLLHGQADAERSEEHTSELQSPCNLVCRLLLEKKKSASV